MRTRHLLVVLCLLPGVLVYGRNLSKAEILSEADHRIERHRKGTITIQLADPAGQPLGGDLPVAVEQMNHAFLFGCNIYRFDRLEDAGQNRLYKERFEDLFNFATLGFYWRSYERHQGQTREEHWKKVASWCREKDICTKGHPLFWTYNPAWLEGLDPAEAEKLSFSRIAREVEEFAGLIDMWDVLNEPHCGIRQGKERNALTAVRLYEKMGQTGVIQKAFQAAESANPGSILILNDYNVSQEYVKIIQDCLAAKVPIDAIGIQSHMHTNYWGPDKTWQVCERFSGFNKPLHFTEVTLVSGPGRWENWQQTTPELEARQAEQVTEFYTVLFSHPAVEAITWWDLSDNGAWQKAPAGLIRADMSEKPAYQALKNLIQEKWWTKLELKTNEQGTIRFSGFKGAYRIRVDLPGESMAGTFRLEEPKDEQRLLLTPAG